MSRYTGYNQSGFANSTVTVTRSATGGITPIEHTDDTFDTVLYLPFDSDVNDDSPNSHTVTASGGATISSAQSKFGGSSGFFDGTDARLRVPSSVASIFHDEPLDFTIEMWIYPTTLVNGRLYSAWGGSNNNRSFLIQTQSAGNVQVYLSDSSNNQDSITSSGGLTVNTWAHIAAVRSGNTVTLYIDGVSKGSTTISNGILQNYSSNVGIGGRGDSGAAYFEGYIDDFRIVKNKAIYTSNFTPPTSALGVYARDLVSLYLPFDSDVNDDSSHGHSVTASGSAAISSTQTKFGSNSLFIDASGDYLSVPSDSSFRFKEGDFTIEMFIRPDDVNTSDQVSGVACIIDHDANASTSGSWFALHQSNQGLVLGVNNGTLITTSNCLSATTWHHVAVVRAGGTTTIYCDGVNVGSASDTHDYDDSTSRNLYIGKQNITFGGENAGGVRRFDGYIDDLRISKGVAQYTKNFVPPSQAVGATLTGKNETNTTTGFTSLYLPFDSDVNDDSDNPFTITASGDAAISSTKSKFGGYSLALDGSGDYLTVGSSQSAMAFAGDFTIEFWMYFTSLGGSYVGPMGCHNSSGWLFQFKNNGGRFYINGSNILDTTAATSTDQWYHVAVSRSGSSVKLFIDGAEQESITYSSALPTNNDLIIGASNASGQYFPGYLDDIRILDGYGKYTADFTPPSSAVSTSVSETVNDLTMLYMPFDLTSTSSTTPASQVEIYVPFESDFGDDGPNSLTLTEAGGGSSSGRDVLIDTAPGSVPFGTNAAHFDNSNYSWNNSNSGRLSTSRDVDFGTNDFTIEFWAYIKSSQTNHAVLISTWSSGGWVIQIDSNTSLKFYDSSSNHATSSLPRNQWAHFAVVRASGVITWYVNGSAETTRTNSGNINGVGNLTIGSYPGGVGGYNGWLKDVRIINGTAVYTSDFSVPTAAHGGNGAPTFTTTQGGFEDLARNHGVTKHYDVTLNTSVKKFGTSSVYFDGSADRVTVAHGGNLNLSDGDFTIEMWVYAQQVGPTRIIQSEEGGDTYAGWLLYLTGSNLFRFYASSSNSSWDVVNAASIGTMALNTWTHLAVTREGGSFRCFKDGVLKSTTTSSSSLYINTDNEISIGGRDGANYYKGYIDDLRIIKGKAIYTEAFTPPSSAHGHVSLETDGSTSETYSDNKFLSGVWDITDVRDKMMQSTWVSNDSRLPNGAGLQDSNHRWYTAPPAAPVTIESWGAGGARGQPPGWGQYNPGGGGGYAKATFTLDTGTSLNVVVGDGGGRDGTTDFGNHQVGPAGGGGANPGNDDTGGGAGGGYSGVFDGPVSQPNALIIAGGGGGGSSYPSSYGGAGGGTTGNAGVPPGAGSSPYHPIHGQGGTQSAGGAGGGGITPGQQGSALLGGTRGPNGPRAGAGGGGGYFGGGSGGMSPHAGAGGGGSGYIHPSGTETTLTTGGNGSSSGGTTGGPAISFPSPRGGGSYGSTSAGGEPHPGRGNPGYVRITDPAGTHIFTAPGTHTVS